MPLLWERKFELCGLKCPAVSLQLGLVKFLWHSLGGFPGAENNPRTAVHCHLYCLWVCSREQTLPCFRSLGSILFAFAESLKLGVARDRLAGNSLRFVKVPFNPVPGNILISDSNEELRECVSNLQMTKSSLGGKAKPSLLLLLWRFVHFHQTRLSLNFTSSHRLSLRI